MGPLLERIVAKLESLPEGQLRDVLDFVDSLGQPSADEVDPFLSIAGSLSGDSLTGDDIERELYGDLGR